MLCLIFDELAASGPEADFTDQKETGNSSGMSARPEKYVFCQPGTDQGE
jgi:hypothetical protein